MALAQHLIDAAELARAMADADRDRGRIDARQHADVIALIDAGAAVVAHDDAGSCLLHRSAASAVRKIGRIVRGETQS